MPEPPSTLVDHVSITVNHLDAAVAFYDAVLAALGHRRVSLTDTAAGYGRRNSREDDRSTYLSVVRVSPPVASSQRHWAFRAPSRKTVDEFHSAALAHGGRDDCGVGLRPEYHPAYYSSFVLDPADGNRVEAVHHRA